MTWYRQVLHVAAKDLRQAKRALAFYYLFIGFELAVAAGLIGSASVFTFFGIPLALFVAALIVQGDSPVRADAFWVTRPLSGSAVIAAKVLAILVGMMVPAILAELLFVGWLGMPAADVVGVLSAALVGYSILLTVAILVATFTSNGRSFLAGLIVLVIISSTIASVRQGHQGIILLPAAVMNGLDGVGLLCCAFAIIDVYRTRKRRRGRLAGVAALALGIGLPLIGGVGSLPSASSVVALAQLNSTTNGKGTPWLDIRFSVQRPAADRPMLSDAEAYIELADGRREPIHMSNTNLKLHDAAFVNDSAIRWLSGELVVQDSSAAQIALNLTDEQVAKLSEGARVRITGTMNLERTRIEATLPLVRGAVGRGLGTRYQFDSVVSRTKPQLEIRSLTGEPSEDPLEGPRSTYLLVNSARHEGVRLVHGSGHGSGVTLPLFNQAFINHATLVPDREFPVKEGAPLVDTEWLAGARLEFLQWTAVRSYPVNIRVDSIAISHPHH